MKMNAKQMVKDLKKNLSAKEPAAKKIPQDLGEMMNGPKNAPQDPAAN